MKNCLRPSLDFERHFYFKEMCKLTKKCNACLKEKELYEFHKRVDGADGYRGVCKLCRKNKNRIPRAIPYEYCPKCKEDRLSENVTLREATNENFGCEMCKKINTELSKKAAIANNKIYYEKNKKQLHDYANRWVKQKRDSNLLYKLSINIRATIKSSIKRNRVSKNKLSFEILKCTAEEFKNHIERQFLNWMSWDNYGNVCETLEYSCSWDLDHIIPVSWAQTEEEVYLLNHWSNFQPLCSKINRFDKKANMYPCSNLELNKTFMEK